MRNTLLILPHNVMYMVPRAHLLAPVLFHTFNNDLHKVSNAPLVTLQKTPCWVGVLICWKVVRLCRRIWTDQLHEVQKEVLSPAFWSQLHAALQTEAKVAGKMCDRKGSAWQTAEYEPSVCPGVEEDNDIIVCISNSMASRTGAVIVPLHLRMCLDSRV